FPKRSGVVSKNRLVIPAVTGNLVAHTVDLANETWIVLRDLTHDEERCLRVHGAELVENPARGRVQSIPVIRLLRLGDLQARSGFNSMVFFDIEAENDFLWE